MEKFPMLLVARQRPDACVYHARSFAMAAVINTGRATHRHILVIGDTFQKTKKKKKIAPIVGRARAASRRRRGGSEASVLCRLEVELQALRAGAEQERELALQQQKQVLEARFQEVLLNRDRLEEEKLHQLSQRLRLEAVEAA
ncbi:hypothetical protein AOXY_G30215 [Acipenser oxyrinchus oxyrinchus]|uniref:Uncharacterized protein n=1 Tax=Acipenser oxyrinchus oxyrinchus TaxID=40147 RepID=A0AAD8CMV5_ACIOX|nr:hypothetical protein AOXY_G30215 [Acipenser oxyrinchus oxyrinchus]